jgi:hypothetical protein
LALANYILRRGEDERNVKNGMTSFTIFLNFFNVGAGVSVGVGVRASFRLYFHVHAQGKHFQGTG